MICFKGGDEPDMIPYFDFGRVTEFKVKNNNSIFF